MADFLRVLFLVPLGFIAAVLAASLIIVVASFGQEPGIGTDVAVTGYAIGLATIVMLRVGAVAAIPVLVFIVLAETFRWRSVFAYLAVGGAIGLVPSAVNDVVWVTPSDQHVLLAAGFVGGFVYWLIAGRLAGIDRVSASPPAPPPQPPTSPE